jgi:hypothetical protein
MSFGKFFEDMKKKTNDFLEKQETKDAISKLKDEFGEAKNKVSKLVDEGDAILKDKVDALLKKKKEGHIVDVAAEDVTDVTVEEPKKEVVVEEPIVETKTEEVVVEAPIVETKIEEVVVEAPIVETKTEEVSVLTLDLADKIKKALNESEFNTVEKLQNATEADLLTVKGVGVAAIKKIKAAI